jgi:hypothetical protein
VQRRPDRGSVAVEFALVAPFLLLLLFGIIEYGVWFADQITVRQGAATGARLASTWSIDDSPTPPWGTPPPTGCTAWDGTPSDAIEALGCSIQASAQPLTGKVYVKIRILPPDQLSAASPTSPTPPEDAWASPNAVRICLLQVHDSITGFIPVPSNVVTARVDMPLEGTSSSGTILAEGQQTLPDGRSWDTSCP